MQTARVFRIRQRVWPLTAITGGDAYLLGVYRTDRSFRRGDTQRDRVIDLTGDSPPADVPPLVTPPLDRKPKTKT